MKILKVLILAAILNACDSNVNTPKHLPYLIYDTKVLIMSGFYAGQQGSIVSQTWMFNPDSYNFPAFHVKLKKDGIVVTVKQEDLKILVSGDGISIEELIRHANSLKPDLCIEECVRNDTISEAGQTPRCLEGCKTK